MRFLAIILIFNYQILFSTNPIDKAKDDFKKVNSNYSSTPNFSMAIQYSVFDNHIGGNLVEQKNGQYVKSSNSSYSKILNIETIVNSKYTVVANNDERVLLITDTKKIQLSPIQTNIDTLLRLCQKIKIKEVSSSERLYTLEFASNTNSEFSKVDICINISNHTIKKIVMYYEEEMPLNQTDYYGVEKKPRLEVEYKIFKVLPASNDVLFSENTYLSFVNNNYKGKGKYLNYKIINQLQSARFKKN